MKWIFLFFSIAIVKFCETKQNLKTFEILTNKKIFIPGDTLKISLKKPNKQEFDSIAYYIGGKQITSFYEIGNKLGDKKISVKLFTKNSFIENSVNIRVLSSFKPKLFTYKIINEYPHDINSYTQGLEFYRDTLYESTGIRGKSSLRKVNFKTGEIFKKIV